eukprot:54793-Pleurochrysis_carterae.AAC.1
MPSSFLSPLSSAYVSTTSPVRSPALNVSTLLSCIESASTRWRTLFAVHHLLCGGRAVRPAVLDHFKTAPADSLSPSASGSS